MKKISFAVIVLLLMLCMFTFTACGGGSGDSGDSGDSADSGDSGNSADSGDSGNSGDSGDSGDSSDSADSRPELTLITNIEGAGTVTGGGHFEYNEDLYINAETNSGYYFFGWYYNNDLLSTSAEYNCKMWDKDVTLEAKFTALPKDYDPSNGGMSADQLLNKKYTLEVKAGMPNYGKIRVDDGDNQNLYTASEKSGTNVKALALTTSSNRFLGWFDEADNLVMANAVFNFVMPGFDYTLTAKWECDCNYTFDEKNATYGCFACGNYYPISELADKNGFVILENKLLAYIGSSSEIVIPDGIDSIGSDVFSNNEKITSVTISKKIKKIEDSAFANCTSIKTIVFEDGSQIEEIGAKAFKKCSSLVSMSIPNSVNKIGEAVFSGCSSLKSIEIPFIGESRKREPSDGTRTFGYLFGRESYSGSTSARQRVYQNERYSDEYTYYLPSGLESVTINGGIVDEYVFANCSMLTQITINSPISTIPERAFDSCSNLETFLIPESVLAIESSAFYKCTSLKTISIPESVKKIFGYAFGECTELKTINYSGSQLQWLNIEKGRDWAYSTGTFTINYGKHSEQVTYSEGLEFALSSDSSFYIVSGIGSCTDENVVIPPSYHEKIVKEIGNRSFYDCTRLASVTIPDGVTSIGYDAFYGCSSLTSVTIPDSVTSIDYQAFYECSSLTSVTIPDGVTSIGSGAFSGCSSLTSVTVPGSVTIIGSGAFSGCSSLTSVTIPDGVTSIDPYAFSGCSSLTSVTIPDSVTSIGNGAFSGCSNLESLTIPFVGDSKSSTSTSSSTLFGYIFGMSSYAGGVSTTQYYNSYLDCATYYIPLSLESVTVTGGNILYGAFSGCSSLTSVTIGNGVTSIDDWAFWDCSSLTSVTIGNGVTSIGDSAFYYCSRLTSVTIPDSVTSIGNGAFEDCYSLTIYCEATRKPSGWESDWNFTDCPVVWGYKG